MFKSTIVISGHGIMLMLSLSLFSLDIWVKSSCVPICYLTERTFHRCRNSGRASLTELLRRRASSCEAERLWFQHLRAPVHCGDCVMSTSWTDWLASSVTGSNSDGFISEEHVYEVIPRTVEDFLARLEAAVSKVNANMLRSTGVNAI